MKGRGCIWELSVFSKYFFSYHPKTAFSFLQLLIRVRLFATPWTAARQAYLSVTNSWSLLKLISIESVMPSNQLVLCCPLLPPAFNLSQHQGLLQ